MKLRKNSAELKKRKLSKDVEVNEEVKPKVKKSKKNDENEIVKEEVSNKIEKNNDCKTKKTSQKASIKR